MVEFEFYYAPQTTLPTRPETTFRQLTLNALQSSWFVRARRAGTLFILSAVGGCGASTSPHEARPASAELSNHLARLEAKLPKGFTWTWQPPFVVIGDEAPDMVRLRAANTVKWAVDRLKQDYFKRDPSPIVDIWLFKDKASYEKWTKKLFDAQPTTPFGYFSPQHDALFMNISTGDGHVLFVASSVSHITPFPEPSPRRVG